MKIAVIVNYFLLTLFHYAGFTADATLQYELGLARHMSEEYSEAEHHYLLAAAQGYAPAQNKLGIIYRFIRDEDSYIKAIEFFRMAADQGYAEAQFNLGEMYEYGLGVKADPSQSQYFYKLAADQEYDEAKDRLKDLRPLLCVIDMQPRFQASQNEDLIKNVQTTIVKAMKKGHTIIFIEYDKFSPTDTRITDIVKDYPTYTIYKYHDSGADKIWQKCKDESLLPLMIKICGVNTAFCVCATVRDLYVDTNIPKIKVIANACNDKDSWHHEYGLREMSRFKRVQIKK